MSTSSRLHVTRKVTAYEVSNVLRSRWLIGYALFFAVTTDALLRFGGDPARALLSLMNVVLIVVPLVSLVIGTMYLYDAREFTELLLAQPIARRDLFTGLLLGLVIPLAAAFLVGVGVPFAIHGLTDPAQRGTLVALLVMGVVLTAIFTACAFFVAVRWEDKVRGLGIAIALWLVCAVLYDGVVLVLVMVFADYPLERPILGLMLANPVDLARVVLLLQSDASALMGYTGAVFKSFFGGTGGIALASLVLSGWIALPTLTGARAFRRKDF